MENPAKHHLSEGEFVVCVDYNIPTEDELRAEFSRVDNLHYRGAWANDPEIDQSPGERIMKIRRVDQTVDTDALLKEIDESGYRHATNLEAYAAVKSNPELFREWVAILGSVKSGGLDLLFSYVAVVRKGELALFFYSKEWKAGTHFLLVRK